MEVTTCRAYVRARHRACGRPATHVAYDLAPKPICKRHAAAYRRRVFAPRLVVELSEWKAGHPRGWDER